MHIKIFKIFGIRLNFFGFYFPHEIYKGKYWFHPKIFEFCFFAQNMFFTDKKSYNVKKAKKKKKFRLSRAAATAVDKNLCHAYSLDHKT
jgi:hypothetical protein